MLVCDPLSYVCLCLCFFFVFAFQQATRSTAPLCVCVYVENLLQSGYTCYGARCPRKSPRASVGVASFSLTADRASLTIDSAPSSTSSPSSLPLCRSLVFDDNKTAMACIKLLTEVGDEEGHDMSMSLFHPGLYLHKNYGKKYEISLQGIAWKGPVAKVHDVRTSRHIKNKIHSPLLILNFYFEINFECVARRSYLE